MVKNDDEKHVKKKKSKTKATKILSGNQGLSYQYFKKTIENPVKISYEDFIKLYEKSSKFPETLLKIPKGFKSPGWLQEAKKIKKASH